MHRIDCTVHCVIIWFAIGTKFLRKIKLLVSSVTWSVMESVNYADFLMPLMYLSKVSFPQIYWYFLFWCVDEKWWGGQVNTTAASI